MKERIKKEAEDLQKQRDHFADMLKNMK